MFGDDYVSDEEHSHMEKSHAHLDKSFDFSL